MTYRRADVQSLSSPLQRTPSLRPFPHLSLSHLWRCAIAVLVTVVFVLGAWSSIVSHAATASRSTVSTPHAIRVQRAYGVRPALPTAPINKPTRMAQSPLVSSQAPFDGLGNLPFYTYITYPISSTTCTCGKKELLVNVANGNLLFHTVEFQIHGTGINLSIEGYYNSLATYSRDLGQNWNFSIGHDVRLGLSNPTVGITYHGPSGYSAYFAFNSSNSTYTDPPGLNATLVSNGDGTYTLTFHKTGEQYTFGTNSHLAAIKDKNNNTISIAYDSDHDVKTITDTHGRVITFTHNTAFGVGHDPEGQVTKIADPTGRSTSYTFTNNLLTGSTDLASKTTTYAYTGSDLTKITDPRGNATTITYDSQHRVISITDKFNHAITFTYNSGSTVSTDKLQHKTTYNLNPDGTVKSLINDNGLTISQLSYNNNYDMTSYLDALTNPTTFSYDPNNNLMSASDSNGVKTSATYATPGFPFYPDTITDAQANTSGFAYDAQGNMLSDKNYSNNVGVSYTYNSDGTVHSSTDANNYTTNYLYTNGDLTSITPPSPLGTETFSYDSLSRVTQVIDGNGNKTTYTYTNLDRVKTTSYQDTSTLTYNYDGNGNELSEVDSNAGTTSFTYDALNRQTKKTLPDTSTIQYGYNEVNNLTSLTDSGGQVTYQYNNLNQLASITEPVATGGNDTIAFGYDNNGQRTVISYPNSQGIGTVITYDTGGRVTEIKTSGQYPTEDDFKYTYTIGSKYTSLRSSVASSLDINNTGVPVTWATNYSYDVFNRLTGAVSTGYFPMTSSYTYDNNGNRLKGSTLSNSQNVTGQYNNTYTYNTANELVHVNTVDCTNDGNGNQTSCGTGFVMTYNQRNQTSSTKSLSNTLTHQYFGGNSTDRVQTTGSYAATYTYNLLGLGTEKDSSGHLIAYTRDNQGNLVSERTSTGNYFYLFDGLGSVVAQMDKNGNMVNTYVYDPYGVTVHQTTGNYNPWQFASGYFDSTTLYYKFGTRYYDRYGRWTQRDLVPSANPWLYAADDPVNVVDPSGKIDVVPEYGSFFGLFSFITGVTVIFTSEDITNLNEGGADYIKFLIGNALSGLGVPGFVKDVILLFIDFQIAELTFFSNFFCLGNGVAIYVSVNSPIPSLQCP